MMGHPQLLSLLSMCVTYLCPSGDAMLLWLEISIKSNKAFTKDPKSSEF